MGVKIDPRTPVLVGAGQVRQRLQDPLEGVEPLELMHRAALRAEADRNAADLTEANERLQAQAAAAAAAGSCFMRCCVALSLSRPRPSAALVATT